MYRILHVALSNDTRSITIFNFFCFMPFNKSVWLINGWNFQRMTILQKHNIDQPYLLCLLCIIDWWKNLLEYSQHRGAFYCQINNSRASIILIWITVIVLLSFVLKKYQNTTNQFLLSTLIVHIEYTHC